MNILFVATESVPYCKTGGLADVVYGLARELCIQNHDIRIVIPYYYGIINQDQTKEIVRDISIPLGTYSRNASIRKIDKTPVFYFVENDYYFGRQDFYGDLDDYERFLFFTRAALEMLISDSFQTQEQWFPQIIQGYDWATGFLPGWFPEYAEKDKRFKSIRFVHCIHNIRSLGIFCTRALRLSGQKDVIFTELNEDQEYINFLGRGILFSDKAVTVNPEYDEFNPLPDSAKTLSSFFREKIEQKVFIGIPNAINYEEFDPLLDRALSIQFNEQKLKERIKNKILLQKELLFKEDERIPMIGMISQLTEIKGLELFVDFKKKILDSEDVQFIGLVEPGDEQYTSLFREWDKEWNTKNNKKGKVYFEFDETKSHRIYAGCDIFLLPSREEPCGIQQYIAMHYGAIPIVFSTGTLHTSIGNYKAGMNIDENQKKGIGFTFSEFSFEAFAAAIKQAIELYKIENHIWNEIQRHNMRTDVSWFYPAKQYIALYNEVMHQNRPEPREGKPYKLDHNTHLYQTMLEINSLSGVADRDKKKILKESAQLIRELIKCDAVFVWILGNHESSMHGEFEIISRSLDKTVERSIPQDEELKLLMKKKVISSKARFTDHDICQACTPISGLSNSTLVKDQHWLDGRSSPIVAHRRILGYIDLFFTKKITPYSDEDKWLRNALAILANSFGFRLETIRYALEKDKILEMDNKLLEVKSSSDAISSILEQAKILTGADASWIYMYNDKNKILEVKEQTEIARAGLPIAQTAVESKKPVYISDFSTLSNEISENFPYRSLIAVPLMSTNSLNVFGVIEAAHIEPTAFSKDEEKMLYRYLAQQATASLEATLWHEQKLLVLSNHIKKLSETLAGSQDMETLMDGIVNTIAVVLNVDAASLYLADEDSKILKIQAAFGYQKPLVAAGAYYTWGDGVTGRIAETNEAFQANKTDILRDKGGSKKGKYDDLQGGIRPTSFYGLPLRVQGRAKPIGVLKVESIAERPFTNEDVVLIEMMGNVIATVVYNTQLSEKRLRIFSSNLEELSNAVTGSKDMKALMEGIVNTIAKVLHVDAASLYLADEESKILTIQAAYGYQKPLVAANASYKWGEGVTGWIAENSKPFSTKELKELREKIATRKGKYDDFLSNKLPSSFYGLPLKVQAHNKPIGILKVESLEARPFTNEDVLLIEMMGNVIATVVYNTQLSEKRLRIFSSNLEKLSGTLAGSQDMLTLMDGIVKTIAEVLQVDAASLYLADEESKILKIQAAYGYQKPLVAAGAFYKWGEGVTGRIAETNKAFQANETETLRDKGGSKKGKYDDLQGGIRPTSFYGLPLRVQGRTKPIGVLKVESIRQRPFTSDDILLIEMMGNVIAAVVYNTKLSAERLWIFGLNLGKLSRVLAGSQDMQTLMDGIVNTIAEVLQVDAASLYLADDDCKILTIQAASGYQKPLVAAGALYKWGEGVTGRIAETNKAFQANDTETLRDKGGSKKGKYDDLQGGKRPISFYGLPLRVKDREKPIGVLKAESLRSRFFTDEDVLLIEMMGNVIATVVYNAQLNRARLESIVKDLGTISQPEQDVASKILENFAQGSNRENLELLAITLSAAIGADKERAYDEAIALLHIKASREVYYYISKMSHEKTIQERFQLFYNIFLLEEIEPKSREIVFRISHQWQNMKEESKDKDKFETALLVFINIFCEICKAKITKEQKYENWYGFLLDTEQTFENTYLQKKLSITFHISGLPQENDLATLRQLLSDHLDDQNCIVLPIWCEEDDSKRVHTMLRNKFQQPFAIDTIIFEIEQIQKIIGAARPEIKLQKFILPQINLISISPYSKVGATDTRFFFGREKELRQISVDIKTKSYAIIGGRRIGKTSILFQLNKIRLPVKGYRTIYHDCMAEISYESFLSKNINWEQDTPHQPPSTFKEFLQNIPTDKPLVLLLDEVDRLIQIDRPAQWRLFNGLRTLSNLQRLQVVVSGEYALREAIRDPNSPLFNFTNEILLGPLEYRAVEELVITPMKQLNINLKNEKEIVDYIMAFTSGHPNVVQRLCSRLIEQVNEQQEMRSIGLENVKKVTEDRNFQKDDFLDTFFERATVLEKIIILLMIENTRLNQLNTLCQELRQILSTEIRTHEVETALQKLVDLRSILKSTPSGYEFKIKAFPEVLSGTMTLKDSLKVYIEEYQGVNK